ncbi:hypothetical protein [Streptomyces longispororuber]|uniref:hypothetical protein n=1 Tax=Streptomyces longispororuber TaxID=68230 RepID=UPI00210F1889|nr:hypothetical protein [Streptomyces longispororuber]MCQ4210424.1 hypothetical protein [Streptomyces longispororuber]
MNTVQQVVLAGQLDDLGNGWIDMFKGWADAGLKVALACIVLYVLVTRFSLKAGVGALLLMVLALGIYNAREQLADKVEDEVNNPAKGAAQPHVPDRSAELAPGVRVPALRGAA